MGKIISAGKLALPILLVFFIWLPGAVESGDNGNGFKKSPGSHAPKAATFKGDPASDPDYLRAIPLLKAGKYKEAIPLLEKALGKPSVHVYAKADYLLCLVWTGAYEKSCRYYLNHEGELSRVSYVYRHVARAFYETTDFLMAQSLYEKALKENPNDIEALKGVVQCLTRQGNCAQARTLLDENAIKLQPLLYHALKAWVFHTEGEYPEAYASYVFLTLNTEEEWFLKEIQDRRKDLAPAVRGEDLKAPIREAISSLAARILLMDQRQNEKALAGWPYEYQSLPLGFVLELGWRLYQSGKTDDSLEVYRSLLARWPRSCLGRIEMAYPLAGRNRLAEAHKLVDGVLQEKCFVFDALFAKAFLYEQEKKRVDAVAVYDEILKLRPGNPAALRWKIRNLSEIGATSLAAEEIQKADFRERQSRELVEGDAAVDQLRWEKAQEALKILEKERSEDPANLRARYDTIAALRKLERMREVVEEYEKLKEDDPNPPLWVTQAYADALLYLQKPEAAVKYYEDSMAGTPRLSPLMGLYYSYQEMRNWEKAEKTLDEIGELLKTEHPEKWPKITAVPQEGWFLDYEDRLRPTLDYYENSFDYWGTRGWLLIYKDQLSEAEKYFADFVEKAGMASTFRMGLAHAYLWRGKPRLALEEFKILEYTDPEYVAGLNGLAVTLNTLNYKKEARELARKLYARYPNDTHVRDTYDSFKVEDMYQVSVGGRFAYEDPGAQEYEVWGRLTEPVTPTFKIFQEIVWQEARDDTNKAYWNRAGVGSEWIVFPELIWRQALTVDYQHIRDWGYNTSLTWWPTDPLRLTLNYDSFSLDIPLRARAEGIEGQAASFNLHYHESDLRNYGLGGGTDWFSDHNQYFYGRLYYDQNVFNRPDFKIRVGGELYYGSYRNQDVGYFAPSDEISLLGKVGFYRTHYHRYDRKFASAIYSRLGIYKQSGNGFYPIGGLTYEQVIETSKTFSLIWNVSWDHKVYDGDSTSVWSGSIHVRKNF